MRQGLKWIVECPGAQKFPLAQLCTDDRLAVIKCQKDKEKRVPTQKAGQWLNSSEILGVNGNSWNSNSEEGGNYFLA